MYPYFEKLAKNLKSCIGSTNTEGLNVLLMLWRGIQRGYPFLKKIAINNLITSIYLPRKQEPNWFSW